MFTVLWVLDNVLLVGSARCTRQLYLSNPLFLLSKLEYSNFLLSHLKENLLALVSAARAS